MSFEQKKKTRDKNGKRDSVCPFTTFLQFNRRYAIISSGEHHEHDNEKITGGCIAFQGHGDGGLLLCG